MAIPQKLADELNKAGLPEPDLHEHLRQNEDVWLEFYPEYYTNGKQLPPIEENRRRMLFVKSRGKKAAAPAQARGTKRQRTTEPPTQQMNVMPTMQVNRLPSQAQDTEVDREGNSKNCRVRPASRGSMAQQVNHSRRIAPATRPNSFTYSDNRRRRGKALQNKEFGRMVNQGWNDVVDQAVVDEQARRSQVQNNMFGHQDGRQDVQMAMPPHPQHARTPTTKRRMSDYDSSSPVAPFIDLRALAKGSIGTSKLGHTLVDFIREPDEPCIPSSPPTGDRIVVNLKGGPEPMVIPSSPPMAGLTGSGYFDGASLHGNASGTDNFDPSRVYVTSTDDAWLQGEGSETQPDMPDFQEPDIFIFNFEDYDANGNLVEPALTEQPMAPASPRTQETERAQSREGESTS